MVNISSKQILDRAYSSLYRAMNFYRSQGVEIPKVESKDGLRPRIQYLDEFCIDIPKRIAFFLGRNSHEKPDNLDSYLSHYKKSFDAISRETGQEFSEEQIRYLIEEKWDRIQRLTPNLEKQIDFDNDIFMFPPIKDKLEDLDFIIAHELWHYIEFYSDKYHGYPAIREATATFAANEFSELDYLYPMRLYYPDFEKMIYFGGAQIIDTQAYRYKGLSFLLDDAWREAFDDQLFFELGPKAMDFTKDLVTVLSVLKEVQKQKQETQN
jgi:hypothetical protein